MSKNQSKPTIRKVFVATPQANSGLRKSLAEWYRQTRRDLPWRRTSDPYRIWVSEVMLQQTQVQTVGPYYDRFIAQFPDVSSLARANLQSVLKLWQGLGYYSRARNLHKSAGIVVNDLGGLIPDTWDVLRRLPGIGDYIAAAVLSIAFGGVHAVVDGNVKRVLARLFLVDASVNQAGSHKVFHTLAGHLLDERNPGNHNQAMMELGALICTPRAPDCNHCPIQRYCKALQKGVVRFYPQRAQRQALPIRCMVAGVIMKKGKVLLVQRPAQGLLGGLWEFPGALLEDGIDSVQACPGKLKSLVNLEVTVERHLDVIAQGYTHFKLQMDLCLCRWRAGRVRLTGYVGFKWLSISQISDLPLHGAMHKALALVNKFVFERSSS
jgi:A/G-specific adenine glycosylase